MYYFYNFSVGLKYFQTKIFFFNFSLLTYYFPSAFKGCHTESKVGGYKNRRVSTAWGDLGTGKEVRKWKSQLLEMKTQERGSLTVLTLASPWAGTVAEIQHGFHLGDTVAPVLRLKKRRMERRTRTTCEKSARREAGKRWGAHLRRRRQRRRRSEADERLRLSEDLGSPGAHLHCVSSVSAISERAHSQ